MFRTIAAMILMSALTAIPAIAQPVDSKSARKMLFSPKGVEVVVRSDTGLPANEVIALEQVAGQVGADSGYYGVVVFSPDEGLLSEATVALANFHSVAAAEAVALATCNGAKTGSTPCRIAAEILPRKFKPRSVTLSRDATLAFKDFRKGRGPKALAVSSATGEWAFFKGEGAAFAARNLCNEKAGGKGKADCETVIADN